MKPGLGRATPKWVVDAERRQKQKDVNINICLDLNLKSTDLDKNLDIVSRLWEEMYRSIQIPRERFDI